MSELFKLNVCLADQENIWISDIPSEDLVDITRTNFKEPFILDTRKGNGGITVINPSFIKHISIKKQDKINEK